MCTNDELILLFANEKFHFFDKNLKLFKSSSEIPIYNIDLVDMIWCRAISKFIVLTAAKLYVIDPISIQISSIESIQSQDKHCFVSCTCSNDTLFLVISTSNHTTYLQCYKLPSFIFLSKLTVTDLIGYDTLPQKNYETNYATEKQKDGDRTIVSVRYNQQRLGILMKIKSDYTLYVLNLTVKPITFVKTKLTLWNDVKCVILAKSGEWLIIGNGASDKLFQISLDCQMITESETKPYSQDSFFSFSTGSVTLRGNLDNLVMLDSSFFIALIHETLAMYQI